MPEDECEEESGSQAARAARIRATYAAEQEPDASDDAESELPDDALRRAERLTRLARRAVDDAEADAYRRDRAAVVGEHGYAATIREDDRDGDVLVCHPVEWLPEGTERPPRGGTDVRPEIDPDRVDDVDRAREVPLEGAADPDGWAAVHERNREVTRRVRETCDDVHAANADALAAYASNHYAKPIAALTAAELDLFREEYYPRNAWPTDEERAALDQSLAAVYEALDVPMPGR